MTCESPFSAEMMREGIITSILVFYKMFMDLFADDRPDIANAAPDAIAILLEHAVVPNIVAKYRVKADAPDYLIGYGPDNEFFVVARLLSHGRAEEIARLLNKNEEMIQSEVVKLIAILKTADGGCSFCVAELLEKFFKEFPEWKYLSDA